jgi:hypothetical protein
MYPWESLNKEELKSEEFETLPQKNLFEETRNHASSDYKLDICNVVSAFDVGCILNLKHIASKAQNVVYSSSRQVRSPLTPCRIYSTSLSYLCFSDFNHEDKTSCSKCFH